MPSTKQARRGVTLRARLAEQVERIAKKRRLSDNRVLVELVEQGLEAQKEKERAFFALAEAFERHLIPKKCSNWATRWGASFSVSDAADRDLVPSAWSNSEPLG